MRARIHRGAEETGGSCVELESQGQRLVLDLGLPLDNGRDELVPLPEIEGLDGTPGSSVVGVVVSHAHPDHYGLLAQLRAGVPVFMGQASEAILREAAFFGAAGTIPALAGHLDHGTTLELGPFRVIAFLVDHSAFDAYALLIEAGERRLFYSGDLRAHGRKPGTLRRLLERPPAGVNALLLEGTRLSRQTTGDDIENETTVERRMIGLMRNASGLVLALYSAQNLDRLVSIYRAALQADRNLVIDPYTAAIARATGRRETIPQADWDRVRIYVPQSQRIRIKRSGAFERVNRLADRRVYEAELSSASERFVLTFRASMIREAERMNLEGAAAIWSMWPGYLRDSRSAELEQFLERHGIPMTVIHASGHARVEDLRALAHAIAPERVIPIHTAAPERHGQLYEKIEAHPNGEWWEV